MSSPLRLLAMDTSGQVCSVALMERLPDGTTSLKGLYTVQHGVTHSQILMPMLDDMLGKAGLQPADVGAVAVAAGPGSFTGLRIGMATAKALCLSLDIPLVPVSTLEAMAYGLRDMSDDLLIPVMDARRDQVYCGIYAMDAEAGLPTECLPGAARSIDELAAEISRIHAENTDRSFILTGDGVDIAREKVPALRQTYIRRASQSRDRQSADAVAALALKRLEALGDEAYADADTCAPDYMRLSQAERQAREGTLSLGKRVSCAPVRYRTAPVKEEEISEASRLEHECLSSEAWSEEQLKEAARREDTIYLVTRQELDISSEGAAGASDIVWQTDAGGERHAMGPIIGLCGVRCVAGTGEITNVCVAASHRGHHVGRRMLIQLLERGRGLGITDYTLEVRASNEGAIRLYEGLGFVREGVRGHFYTDPEDDALIYWLRERGEEA